MENSKDALSEKKVERMICFILMDRINLFTVITCSRT